MCRFYSSATAIGMDEATISKLLRKFISDLWGTVSLTSSTQNYHRAGA